MAESRILFVTGRLAEPSLRRTIDAIGIQGEIAVLPISVAALLTTPWIASHLNLPPNIERIVLPGYCRGDLNVLTDACRVPVERGPRDLRELPDYLTGTKKQPPDMSRYSIEIIAEINHAPQLSMTKIMALAADYRRDGADVIDIGCDPGTTWAGVADAVKALRDAGNRVSIDSLNPTEIAAAVRAGAELVLSVNSENVHAAADWGAEVVVIPDEPKSLARFDATINCLVAMGVRFRLDPVIEPIGFGFAASLGRYIDVRKLYPDAAMMMGIGNLTELTDVDSAGINVLLAGFCEELRIGSVLTTQVINWCRSAVRELDLARRLVSLAVREQTLPKKITAELLTLRDPKLKELGETALDELAALVKDPNYRLFAERGEIHLINSLMYLRGTDPFALIAELLRRDPSIDASHAFYLGYEMCKALTAVSLGKNYTQDQPLRWGFLTQSEQGGHSELPPSLGDAPS